MTLIAAARFKALIIAAGMFIIVAGSTVIFAFSTQILVPAQPAIPGYWEWRTSPTGTGSQRVWHAGQPSRPEHFETSYPNFPPGSVLILVGLAISATGLLFCKRETCAKDKIASAHYGKILKEDGHS